MDLHASGTGILYLGVSGVLHPSRNLYELLKGKAPEADGHREYEGVGVLQAALRGWPQLRIVLTSTQTWLKGLTAVMERLGPELASRVIGDTYGDLTTKAQLGPRQAPLGHADYWRYTKAEIVRAHADWLRPAAWIAVDDETLMWSANERLLRFVQVNGCEGLLDPATQDRLLTVLEGTFGLPQPRAA